MIGRMENRSGVGTSAGRGLFEIMAMMMLAQIDNRRAEAKNQRIFQSISGSFTEFDDMPALECSESDCFCSCSFCSVEATVVGLLFVAKDVASNVFRSNGIRSP